MRVSFHRIIVEDEHLNTGGYPMAQQGAGVTRTPNPQYDLASVLYHALEGAQTYDCSGQERRVNILLSLPLHGWIDGAPALSCGTKWICRKELKRTM